MSENNLSEKKFPYYHHKKRSLHSPVNKRLMSSIYPFKIEFNTQEYIPGVRLEGRGWEE